MEFETVVELPAPLAAMTAVRSTLIQSSLTALKKRGYFERYLQRLDPAHKHTILETLAPEWLSVEVATAHYAACDALELSAAQLHDIGDDVGERIQVTFIATLVRNARNLGLTPWMPLGQFQRLRERLMQGGGVSITKTGPKDAVVDVRLVPLFRYTYFRVAYCGVISSCLRLGAGKSVSVRLASSGNFDQRCQFKCAWV